MGGMSKKMIISIGVLFVVAADAAAQEVNKSIQAGNDLYKQQQYEKAAAEYSKALELEPDNSTAKYNLANTLYKQGKQVEASKLYTELARDAGEPELRSKSYYNNGVMLSKQKRLEESIEAYKNALRQNPADKDARENLQKALLELKKKNPPKKEDKKENKKKQNQQQQNKQPQSKLSPKEAEQRLKLLEQKEKEVQQRLQKEKSKTGGQPKDW